jgi:antitoxin (DNA-binding transcriptional repressor) of toxin-antitoxin stability system
MSVEITGEDLEARFFEILKQVCRGESYTIVVEGRAVAELRPSAKHGTSERIAKVLEELCSPRFEGASDETIREWLGEGQSSTENGH